MWAKSLNRLIPTDGLIFQWTLPSTSRQTDDGAIRARVPKRYPRAASCFVSRHPLRQQQSGAEIWGASYISKYDPEKHHTSSRGGLNTPSATNAPTTSNTLSERLAALVWDTDAGASRNKPHASLNGRNSPSKKRSEHMNRKKTKTLSAMLVRPTEPYPEQIK